jgi:WD40 repeat protein
MRSGPFVAILLLTTASYCHAQANDAPLEAMEKTLSSGSEKPNVPPNVRPVLKTMEQDVRFLRSQVRDALPKDYQQALRLYNSALQRVLNTDPFQAAEVSLLNELAADLRAKAEFARHGSSTESVRAHEGPVIRLARVAGPAPEFVSAGTDKTLGKWAGQAAQRLWQTPVQLEGQLSAFATSPDGNLTACGSSTGAVKLFNGTEPGPVFRPGDGAVTALTFVRGQNFLAVGSRDGRIHVCDTNRQQTQFSFRADGRIQSLHDHGEGLLCAVRGGNAVDVWDLRSRSERPLHTLRNDRTDLTAADQTPDGRVLLTASRRGMIDLWQVREGKLERAWDSKLTDVRSVTLSPDGKLVAVAGGAGNGAGEMRIWSLDGRGELDSFHFASAVLCCAFSSDGQVLTTGHADGILRFFSLLPGKPDPGLPIHVEVRTVTVKGPKKELVPGYDVYYLCGWDSRNPGKSERFNDVTNQAVKDLPAGRYIIWASNETHATPKVSQVIDSRCRDPIVFVVPQPKDPPPGGPEAPRRR